MVSKTCEQCGESSYMLFPCRHCGKSFCAPHRLPENHGCAGGASTPASTIAPGYGGVYSPNYADQDLEMAQQLARAQSRELQPREYVWEPKITEFDGDPFDPKSGVVLRGVAWPKGKEIFHILIAFVLMFFIGILISNSAFVGLTLPGFEPLERQLFPYFLASMSTSGFLIHEFAHRQTGRRFKLPAKFRLLTFGLMLTALGIIMYFVTGGSFPPFALPGAVVVIGLEKKDQAGKCKAAGPISNLIISLVLILVAFVTAMMRLGFEYFILFFYGAYMNSFLGLFNLLPIGLLDGHEIFKYKKWLWIALFTTLLGLLIFELIGVLYNANYWYSFLYS
ncbi:MAG: AN1-type zinc finger domain-containing protein [Candidatus Sigynarchaeota archaeon]